MRYVTASKVLLFAVPLSFAGCCAFVPCHPGTLLFGTVSTFDGQHVANAEITMYGSKQVTDALGCFKMRAADGLPFTFEVAVPGYKTAAIGAKPGFYRVVAKLARAHSAEQSSIEWLAIFANQYESTTLCKQ